MQVSSVAAAFRHTVMMDTTGRLRVVALATNGSSVIAVSRNDATNYCPIGAKSSFSDIYRVSAAYKCLERSMQRTAGTKASLNSRRHPKLRNAFFGSRASCFTSLNSAVMHGLFSPKFYPTRSRNFQR
jgi:hypothetical protein